MIQLIHQRWRRRPLVCAGMLLVGVQLRAGDETWSRVKIEVEAKTVVNRIAPDFIGLGYETSAVAQTNYFCAANATLVQLYRNLSAHGLIRIGGIISDHTRFEPDGTPVAQTANGVTIVNQTSLQNLGDFARATGWQVMWGLNLGTGSKTEAVAEALAVNAALGNSLQSFEIGNEVDNLPPRRYDNFHARYLDYKAGIRAVLPAAPFSGPDSIGKWEYITNFANAEAKDMKLLTIHYYRGGARSPNATLERLLQHDDALDERLQTMRQIYRDHGIPYRLNEVNSFSGGGKAGVSDTFGSALWCLDYMFLLAEQGCAGVNLETDINQLGFISHYSPIVHDTNGQCQVRPEYYALLAFAMAGRGDLLKLDLDKDDINLTAYATKDDRSFLWVTVINKDFSRNADLEITLPDGYATAAIFRLDAPSMESKNQVTLAGAEVSTDGKWVAGVAEPLTVKNGLVHLHLPHASAVLIRLK